MLKITKGLKKKKKGKKNKHKEEELFDSAELEQYRREHQKSSEENADDSKESEEWQKFKALTSGVDDILKKTQGDLDRIKSTSYFQKKQPGPSDRPPETTKEVQKPVAPVKEKKWVDFENEALEEGEAQAAEEGQQHKETEKPEPSQGFEENQQRAESEEETEEEDEPEDDDLFDTSYVDVVASGQVKLAFIPESPTQEETSFDPFDTSIADKVIKSDSNGQKKPLVSLGSAVQVLTGQIDKSPSTLGGEVVSKASKRRRQLKQDLLLGSFDEDSKLEDDNKPKSTTSPPKSILDQDPLFDGDPSQTVSLAPVTPLVESGAVFFSEEDTTKLVSTDALQTSRELIEEFEPTLSNPAADLEDADKAPSSDEDLEDEFTALATESVTKEVKTTEEKLKPPRPPVPQLPPTLIETSAALLSSELSDQAFDQEEGDDPFDTSFASKVLPGKFELKIIEREILSDDTVLERKPSIDIKVQEKINIVLKANEEEPAEKSFRGDFLEEGHGLLNFKHRDLLGGSTTDLSKIGHTPIQPAESSSAESKNEASIESDPFDTSAVEILAAPGKTELKYLEEELLQQQVEEVALKVEVEVDNDFDPRAGETVVPTRKPSRPDKLPLEDKKLLVPKVVAFDVESPSNLPDLLAVGKEEGSKISKPLTPYYPNTTVLEEKASFESQVSDPFDTSFVTNCPGKVELKLLESELVGSELKHSLSDPDFNPREEQDQQNIKPILNTFQLNSELPKESIDYFATGVSNTQITGITEEFQPNSDPFDTSVANTFLPVTHQDQIIFPKSPSGASIQAEVASTGLFIHGQKDSEPTGTDIYDNDENITAKPLTPLVARSSIVIPEEEIDPFDTSIVGEILPGKTELKLLESELMSN